ncbi:ABC transporter ATP-binding protein [Tabrizicola sp.]|uniref:ABC transporter ATP-binding protein n=1 Tax=Tabrizicola sp. TaxID=2005166 RepID=UPI002607584B|nr:ABC transporter ATP-binding protein [Tabrizicola sp.]MDM7932118.1 ABC transporter ATP-binding protein [Tabrizicola sp.]
MTALDLAGLTKRYPVNTAPTVQALDLTVESGSLTALLGPSGSGKTTVMKLIAGLLTPDEGDIRLGGQSIRDLPPERRRVVMVFQSPLLFPHMTVAENVGFGLRMRGVAPSQTAARTAAMLEKVRLTGLGTRRPVELSGGQQQRAALARALVLEPDLLLLDEPLSNLDASLRDEMRDLILSLQRETGVTTLVVTHDQSEAVILADRIALLLDGRLAQHATPDEIYRRPASRAVAEFFGGVNFLPGQAAGGVFQSDLGPLPLPPGHIKGGSVLTIRPEAIVLGPGPDARDATVLACTFLGTQTRVELDLGGTRLQALTNPWAASELAPGDRVDVTLPQDALWLLSGS